MTVGTQIAPPDSNRESLTEAGTIPGPSLGALTTTVFGDFCTEGR
jgi:hypothetical protein